MALRLFGSEMAALQHVGSEMAALRLFGSEMAALRHVGSEMVALRHVGSEMAALRHVGSEMVALRHVGSETVGVCSSPGPALCSFTFNRAVGQFLLPICCFFFVRSLNCCACLGLLELVTLGFWIFWFARVCVLCVCACVRACVCV